MNNLLNNKQIRHSSFIVIISFTNKSKLLFWKGMLNYAVLYL